MSDRPTNNDRAVWKAFWEAQGMPWRTEPEIDKERQRYLAERQAVTPDVEEGIYPFRDKTGRIKLNRADVEWLLATHESAGVRGPVDWGDEKQHGRAGLDIQLADLRSADLSRLPLASTNMADTLVERTIFQESRLQNSSFYVAAGREASFRNARLYQANLTRSRFPKADFAGADLSNATLGGADLRQADLSASILAGASLLDTLLGGAELWRCRMDENTDLSLARLGDKSCGFAVVIDTIWGGANVAAINWATNGMPRHSTSVNRHIVLGDEILVRNPPDIGHMKAGFYYGFGTAIRAYRQLAAVLRNQGANEQADELLYRAHVLRQDVLRMERKWLPFVGSLLLNGLSGFGYRPLRSLITYVAVIFAFAGVYFVLSPSTNLHLTPIGAIVTSMVSFHGRGFFPGQPDVDGVFMRFVAVEALCGLLLEITFIATFTQRFFAR